MTLLTLLEGRQSDTIAFLTERASEGSWSYKIPEKASYCIHRAWSQHLTFFE